MYLLPNPSLTAAPDKILGSDLVALFSGIGASGHRTRDAP